MIYLSSELQQKIVPLFHYALNPGGYLFLGPSESVSSRQDLFRPVDKQHRIFQKKEAVVRPVVKFPLAEVGREKRLRGSSQPQTEEQSFSKQLEHIIVQRYRPACVTVRENGEAVYFSGGTARYLEQPVGVPSINAITMAREGLRIPLRTALHKAVTAHERVVQKEIPLQTETGPIHIDLTVDPIAEFQAANLYMVLFEEVSGAKHRQHAAEQAFDPKAEETIRHLEAELRAAQENSQAVLEELESSNEELKSANEEYQSTNEELETSKEEVQSFNEELETVNAELNRHVAELDAANGDLQNLIASTQIATLFLDTQLHIKSFTPAAGSVFRLIAGDIGRPITDVAAQFADDDITGDISETLRTLVPCERDIAGERGKHYLMRILPYRSVHNVIDGAVLTLTDVTSLKEAQREAEEAKRVAEEAKLIAQDAQALAENIVNTVREPLLVLDANLHVKSANRAFFESFQVNANEALGRSLFDLGDRRWDSPDLRRLLREILPEKKQMEDFRIERNSPNNGGLETMLLNARKVITRNGEEPLILLAIEDITMRSRAEKPLLEANRDLKHFAYAASHDLQEPLRMVTSYTQLLAKHYAGTADPVAEQLIAYAVGGAQRMEMMLNGLREYWSINEENIVREEIVDCNRLIETALANLADRIEQSGAVVTHDPLPSVHAEIVPLELLFQNLISNALKYVRKGEAPRIHIAAKHNGAEWEFSVRDNGIGIEAKFLSTIFTPFKRLHGVAYPGSGLGLAICARIVERYNGRIWAESTYGRGSTFHFTIPRQPDEGDERSSGNQSFGL